MSTPRLTIFTPAYNRAHTLPRTYQSLLDQSCKDFVWLIVDDGSSDGTAGLVKDWMSRDNGFEIEYVYKQNGGMHTAHNTAYEHIHTELNTCIDSDDALAKDAAAIILRVWAEKGEGHPEIAGIVGLDADMNTGNVIGTKFEDGCELTTINGFYDRGGSGDKKLVYRTDVMQSLPPYPVFPGEKYVSLGYKYLLCDQTYQLIAVNEVLCDVEYQADGSSMNMLRQYKRNPQGFAFWRKQSMIYNKGFIRHCKECIHYVSCSIFTKNRRFLRESPKPFLTFLAIPAGCLLNLYIRVKVKN